MEKKEPPKIRVVIRKRPLFGKEVTRNDKDIMTVVGEGSLLVQEMKEKLDLTKYIEEHSFTFDNVFDAERNNEELYEECVKPLVSETFKGAKTTCFAYGQTGSGKTFTMMGTRDGSVSGMYTLAAYDIVYLIENCYDGLEVYISFYEIYCGELYDLLNKRTKVACREDAKQRVNIVNLTEKHAPTVEVIMDTIHEGLKARTSGKTGANEESSRSHAILVFSIKAGGKLFSKMSFIDLAGSERGADVIDTGKKTKQDGAEINKSLLALKECIRALDRAGKKGHLPFRGSKLT
jgi:kinesin family protein 2/24